MKKKATPKYRIEPEPLRPLDSNEPFSHASANSFNELGEVLKKIHFRLIRDGVEIKNGVVTHKNARNEIKAK